MGGFLGVGGSSASTDRGNQLAATSGEWNVYNYGLGQGEPAQATGTSTLTSALQPAGEAQNYFSQLLNGGRTQTEQNAAPSINATLAGADAQRAQQAQMGTGRSGGTASLNAQQGATTTSNVDNIINSNLVSGQATGAQGLDTSAGITAGIGNSFLSNAMNLLGLGSGADTNILNNATASRGQSYQINQQTGQNLGNVIGSLATNFPQILAAIGLG